MKNAVNKAGVDLLNIKHHPQSAKKVNPLPTLSFQHEITNRQHWSTLPMKPKYPWVWYLRIWFSGEYGGGWGQNLVILEVFSNLNYSVKKNDIILHIIIHSYKVFYSDSTFTSVPKQHSDFTTNSAVPRVEVGKPILLLAGLDAISALLSTGIWAGIRSQHCSMNS